LAIGLPTPARADVHISIDPGAVAFGYRDGYWDRERHWHGWAHRRDHDWYRDHYRDHYYDRRHDAERDHGWREADRWWDRR
jgi:hypothetical protein